ncbi:CU044_2847 family protein [Winogradskya humida]|uniref:Trypsin-co-occurring domain-containing protein n=1 Tax=Winogradskya humida TaxID=113566 RepID=A0ABQ3ZWP8_9ACTN|nr:CU044_2847 family protein [Actinoplanes humidus]GIE23025.1 hypothetical protein Ahu01nite_061270 [Actinoplanes humidus]
MSELTRFELQDGAFVYAEDGADGPVISTVSRTGDVLHSATASFGAALRQVRTAAEEALTTLRDMDTRPDRVELEFGVKLSAEAGAVIARTGADGHFKVKLTWNGDGEPEAEGQGEGEDS